MNRARTCVSVHVVNASRQMSLCVLLCGPPPAENALCSPPPAEKHLGVRGAVENPDLLKLRFRATLEQPKVGRAGNQPGARPPIDNLRHTDFSQASSEAQGSQLRRTRLISTHTSHVSPPAPHLQAPGPASSSLKGPMRDSSRVVATKIRQNAKAFESASQSTLGLACCPRATRAGTQPAYPPPSGPWPGGVGPVWTFTERSAALQEGLNTR